MSAGLLQHLARFCGALRAGGARVSLSDELDALQALLRVDLGEPAEVRAGLRCALKIRRQDAELFEQLFAEQWLRAGHQPLQQRAQPSLQPPPPGAPRKAAAPGALLLAGNAEQEVPTPDGGEPGQSREQLLRKKSFEECDDRDLPAMERLLWRLAEQLATRRSRRLQPVHARGRPDPRRSLRLALATGGELIELARRDRPIQTPRLVLLLDTSGSMEPHARFLLAFARALKRVAGRTEVFAFNTSLTRVTPMLAASRLQSVVAKLQAGVPDWSGGTRIGESLEAFAAHWMARLVDSTTVIVVLSDGLDRGEPERIAHALRRIRSRARRVLWLNPLLSDPRYEPTARGMAAALPYVDRLAAAHNLEALEKLLPDLAA